MWRLIAGACLLITLGMIWYERRAGKKAVLWWAWRVLVFVLLLLTMVLNSRAVVLVEEELFPASAKAPAWVAPGRKGSSSSVSATEWGLFHQRELLRRANRVTRVHQEGLRADSTHSYDAIRYELEIYIQHSANYISGEMRMTFVAREALSTMPVHLSHLTCNEIRLDDDACEFALEDDVLQVLLPATVAAGDTALLYVNYEGTPWTDNDLGMSISNGVAYTASDPWGTRQWAPCYDEPFEKALWDVSVRVGSDFEVLSNGSLLEIEDLGDGTECWHYRHSYPISSYLVSVCAANYTVVDSNWGELPIGWMVYPSHAAAAQAGFSRLGDMLTCYTELYGEYPFERYYMAEAPIYTGWGGMEHQTCTTMGNNLVAGGLAYEAITTHELSHQWWGDALTPVDFRAVWLNEGWATYSEPLYFQYQADGDWGEFLDYMHQIHQTYLSWDGEYLPIYDPPLDDLFNVSQYEKAASVIHMLRYVMGEESFWQSVHDWYNTYLYLTVDSEDYRGILEAASGLDLEWFFDQWIYQGGYPTYRYGYQTFQDADSCTVAFSVTQTHQVQDTFSMPVPVRVTTSSGSFDYRVTIDEEGGQVAFRLPGQLEELEFNTDEWILCRQMEVVLPDQVVFVLNSLALNDEIGGNGDGHLVSGECADLVLELVNEGGYGRNLQFSLETEDPRITVSGQWPVLAECFYGEAIHLEAGHVHLTGSSINEPGPVELSLTIRTEDGEDLVLPLRVLVGLPEILLVDDDDQNDYGLYYTPALDSLGAWHDCVTASQLSTVDVGQYRALIWYTGDSGNGIDMDELVQLRRLFNAGVAVCITGQDAVDQWPQDSLDAWFSTSIESESNGQVYLNGQPDTFAPISGLLIGASGALNQTSPSSLSATWNLPLAYYQDGSVAAVCTHNGPGPGGAVLFGFGLEALSGMANTASRERWLDFALALLLEDWADVAPPAESALVPRELELAAAPNPFNPMTRLYYTLPLSGPVILGLYDLTGRCVRELVREPQSAGQHELVLEAGSLASGLYLLNLRAAGLSRSERLLLIK